MENLCQRAAVILRTADRDGTRHSFKLLDPNRTRMDGPPAAEQAGTGSPQAARVRRCYQVAAALGPASAAPSPSASRRPPSGGRHGLSPARLCMNLNLNLASACDPDPSLFVERTPVTVGPS